MRVEGRWLEAGVGVPTATVVATDLNGGTAERWGEVFGPEPGSERAAVVLDSKIDPQFQTAFGLAVLLDAWEFCGVPHLEPKDLVPWAQQVSEAPGMQPWWGQLLQRMADRATQIGQDHHIRRALGWEIEPGTLATLEALGDGDWGFRADDGASIFSAQGLVGEHVPALTAVPAVAALAGVPESAMALRVIAEAVEVGDG